MNKPEIITNREGRIIGRSQGNLLFNREGRLIARYDPIAKITFTREGKIVGNDDQRLRVLK